MAANDTHAHDIEAPLPGTNVVDTDQAPTPPAKVEVEPTGPQLPPTTVGARSTEPKTLHTQKRELRSGGTEELVARNLYLTQGRVGLKTLHLIATIVMGSICVWVSVQKSHDECGSKPLKMKDWFMGTGISNLVGGLIILCLLCALCSIMNVHNVRAAVLKSRGREAEAERELSAGASQTERGACVMCCSVCGMVCLLNFGIIWGILGIISVVSAGSDANKAQCPEYVYYWVIFATSMGISCCCQCIESCCIKNPTAHLPD